MFNNYLLRTFFSSSLLLLLEGFFNDNCYQFLDNFTLYINKYQLHSSRNKQKKMPIFNKDISCILKCKLNKLTSDCLPIAIINGNRSQRSYR